MSNYTSSDGISINIGASTANVQAQMVQLLKTVTDSCRAIGISLDGMATRSISSGSAMRQALGQINGSLTGLSSQAAASSAAMQGSMNSLAASVNAQTAAMNQGFNNVVNGLNNMNRTAVVAGKGTEEALNGVGAAMKKLIGWFAIFAGIKKFAESAAEMEVLHVRLNAVMGSAEAGGKAFQFIVDKAKQTPYTIQEVTKAFMVMETGGLKPLNGSLQSMMDTMAKYNPAGHAMVRVVSDLAHASMNGHMMLRHVNQMANNGVPALQALATVTGKTKEEIHDLATNGQLNNEVMDAMIKELGRVNAGSAIAQMNTMKGVLSNVKDTFDNLSDTLNKEDSFGPVKDGIKEVMGWFNRLNEDGTAAEWASGLRFILAMVGDAWRAIWPVITATQNIFTQVFSAVTGVINMFAKTSLSNADVVNVAFLMLRDGIVLVCHWIQMSIEGATTTIKVLAQVVGAAVDFIVTKARMLFSTAEAADSLAKGLEQRQREGAKSLDSLLTSSGKRIADIKAASNELMNTMPGTKKGFAEVKGGMQGAPEMAELGEGKEKEKKGKKPPSHMTEYEERLNQQKKTFMEENELREMQLKDIEDWWARVLATEKVTADDRARILKTISSLQVSQMKEEKKQRDDRATQAASDLRADAERQLAIEMDAAKNQLDQKEMSQQQYLQLEIQFAARKREIRLAEMEADKAIAERAGGADMESKIAKIRAQMAALKAETSQSMKKLQAEINNTFGAGGMKQDLKTSSMGWISDGIDAIYHKTLTLKGALTRIYQDIAKAFLKHMVVEPVQNWMQAELFKTMATEEGEAVRLGVQEAASAMTIGLKAQEAITNIMNSAYEAMAGAWKAIVGIPYVGPVLAPIAAGAAFAGVAALAGSIMSAEGGYRIPAGVNPIMQLHEKEVVLPSGYAEGLDQLFAAGGIGGAGVVNHNTNVTQNIYVKDADGIRKSKTQIQREYAQGIASIRT